MVWSQGKTSTSPDDVHNAQNSAVEPRIPAKKLSKGPQQVPASSNATASSSDPSSASLAVPSSIPRTAGKLRVQIIGAHGLAAQDRNGLADPFVIVNLPGAPPPPSSTKKEKDFYRRRTPMQPKTLAPKWKDNEATFEWSITTDWYKAATDADARTDEEATEEARPEKGKMPYTSAEYTESPNIEKTDDPLQNEGSRLEPPTPQSRPSNVRKLSAATGKILTAPVRMTTRGAVATTRAVRRRGPRRPMRLGRANGSKSNSTLDLDAIHQASVGSIEFVVWDKDKWSGNDYMGECSLQVGSWIAEGRSALWDLSEVSGRKRYCYCDLFH
jgi:phosphatidylserine decarboxylase